MNEYFDVGGSIHEAPSEGGDVCGDDFDLLRMYVLAASAAAGGNSRIVKLIEDHSGQVHPGGVTDGISWSAGGDRQVIQFSKEVIDLGDVAKPAGRRPLSREGRLHGLATVGRRRPDNRDARRGRLRRSRESEDEVGSRDGPTGTRQSDPGGGAHGPGWTAVR